VDRRVVSSSRPSRWVMRPKPSITPGGTSWSRAPCTIAPTRRPPRSSVSLPAWRLPGSRRGMASFRRRINPREFTERARWGQGGIGMGDTYDRAEQAAADREQQQSLLTALNAWDRALRKDECNAWVIAGKNGTVHTWGDGHTWIVRVR